MAAMAFAVHRQFAIFYISTIFIMISQFVLSKVESTSLVFFIFVGFLLAGIAGYGSVGKFFFSFYLATAKGFIGNTYKKHRKLYDKTFILSIGIIPVVILYLVYGIDVIIALIGAVYPILYLFGYHKFMEWRKSKTT